MTTPDYLLALDQGTTSTRAMAFDLEGSELARSQIALTQYFPKPGWVEHEPQEIWQHSQKVISKVIAKLGRAPIAMGITNQRETTLLWDRKTGKPVTRAIVWQDRRTAKHCQELKGKGLEPFISGKTGLLLDPYFSATKLAWIFEHQPELRKRARAGGLCFGTVESYLLFRLTGFHGSDATNASRTLLYNIHEGKWDQDLLDVFELPKEILPEVLDNAFEGIPAKGFGFPVTALVGDQQGAAIGQAAIHEGAIKSTYGTGCFVLQNTGGKAPQSKNRLLTTVAYQLGGKRSYALEGSIFIAGAVIQWLRDGLGIIKTAEESEKLVQKLEHNEGVYMVPAFTGLGAPHWDPEARGAIFGLTRDSGPEHLARAALESVAYQTFDLLTAFEKDSGQKLRSLRVDGGMVANDWFVQFLSDILGTGIERPRVQETTALGAAFLAGLGAGVYKDLSGIRTFWQLDRAFEPNLDAGKRADLLSGWHDAISRVKMDL